MNSREWTPAKAGTWLAAAIDAIALLALFASGEIALWAFATVAAIGALAAIPPLRVSRGVLTMAYLALVLGSATAWLNYRVHPITVAAHVAPIAHALLWLTERGARARSWRLGMGFVVLVLASALTPDLYLPAAIILFAVLGSVALSCSFLEEEYRARRLDLKALPLPPRYIARSAGLAVVIFLSAGLIFPILPRVRVPGGGPSRDLATTGYTEVVSLSEWKRFTDSENTAAALQLYVDDERVLADIPYGLFKSRVLEAFDGERWMPRPDFSRPTREPSVPAPLRDSILIEGTRLALSSTSMPVPYGTDAVWTLSSVGETRSATVSAGNQWSVPGSSHRAVPFRLQLSPSRFYSRQSEKSKPEDARPDPPRDVHTFVPPRFRTERMSQLQVRVFADARSPRQKVLALRQWYSREGFSAEVRPEDVELAQSPELARFTPIERFLLAVKRGHCELFASSAAVLLRIGGVPTRLVAGFRMAKSPLGGVLTVRQSDAHAWLEYYDPERGWEPVDLTPRLSAPNQALERLRDAVDLLNAYWSRYVVGFAENEGTPTTATERMQNLFSRPEVEQFASNAKDALRNHWPWIVFALLVSTLGFAAGFWVIRTYFPTLLSIRFRVREGAIPIRNERLKLERLLRGHGIEVPAEQALPAAPLLREALRKRHGDPAATAFDAWLSAYEAARFGSSSEASSMPREAARARKQLARALAA